jgi:hypothetical protein
MMPAYFTMEVAFKKNALYECFVRDVYDIFSQSGFKFKCGFWYGKDMSMEQIIEWNQKHLQNKFELGFTEQVKHDYKQILLDTDIYSELRLYWIYTNERIYLHLIVPEFDVRTYEGHYYFVEDKIRPLLLIACNVWDTGLTSTIQSYLELDEGGVDIEELEQGQLPQIHPFCIIDKNLNQGIALKLKGDFNCKSLSNDGILIIDNSWLKDNSSQSSYNVI